jgi:transcriptional regulator with XRE-family HTH domain
MKERLLQLIDLEHLTPSKFADLIGVQRSSVSHILSDRNKPSFDFLQKTLKTFPGLKADWLMLGDGPMYEQMGRESGDLFSQDVPETLDEPYSEAQDLPETDSSPVEPPISEVVDYQDIKEDLPDKSRRVVQVMLLYDDDTFVTYKPSQ